MAGLISSYLGVEPKDLMALGAFDAVIGVDTHLFLDPHLLKNIDIPEFKKSREKIIKYFQDIIKLLLASKSTGDKAWKEAFQRLNFKELEGVSIGYGVSSSDGNAIGPVLATKLLKSAVEILDMGIKDPEIFELLGLFEEDFGADRLSDMTLVIIQEDIYTYTSNIAAKLRVRDLITLTYQDKKFHLPKHPTKNKPLLFLPQRLLLDLPVALSWDGIDKVVSTNRMLRERINKLIGLSWKNKITKGQLREQIFSNKENLIQLLEAYKATPASSYDFEKDPAGEVTWYNLGKKFADENPVDLSLSDEPTQNELTGVVDKIIFQFRKNVELNGLKEFLYTRKGVKNHPRHERYSQLLFFSTADSYCTANNLDLSREPNAGSGPVDFKISRGNSARVLVEIKLSSNKRLIHGFQKQLPLYQESENVDRAVLLVIKTTQSDHQIKQLQKLHAKAVSEGKKVPAIAVVDATIKPSASKR